MPHADLILEIDVYLARAEGLILAEVKLRTVDIPLMIPFWIGAEVTKDRRFHNSAIGLAPQIARSLMERAD